MRQFHDFSCDTQARDGKLEDITSLERSKVWPALFKLSLEE